MRKFVMMALLITALALAIPTIGQGLDGPLPACTTEEAQEALLLLRESEVIDSLEETLQSISENVDYLVTGYAELMLIRNTYYLDVQPHLEDCSAIWFFELKFGDYLTNTTLNTGNLIIGILANDIDALATLTEPMNDTMFTRRMMSGVAFRVLRLEAGENLSDD